LFKCKSATLVMLLALAFLIPSACAVVSGEINLDNLLVTSGQEVTLEGPEPVALEYVDTVTYDYLWTVTLDGATIATGTDRVFTFSAPEVTQKEVSKTIQVSLLVTDGFGCIGEISGFINVYPLPVCGFEGPTVVSQDLVKYAYVGGTLGILKYSWSVDGVPIAEEGQSSVEVDWSAYEPGIHTLELELTRDYSDVEPNAADPFRTIFCTYDVEVVMAPGVGIGGPEGVCEDDPIAVFFYTGDDTTVDKWYFTWYVDDIELVGNAEEIEINWNELGIAFGDHVASVIAEKTYASGAVASSTSEMTVKYIESPTATISLTGVA